MLVEKEPKNWLRSYMCFFWILSVFHVLHALDCKTHQDFRRKIYEKHILVPSEAQIHNILQMG
jgi:hypothetical protein